MVRIKGEVVIERPVEEVFDFAADERNAPQYDPQIRRATMTSSEPIGAGTRFVGETMMLGLKVEIHTEITGYDRPRRIASTSNSLLHLIWPLRMLDGTGAVEFEEVPGGTRMTWNWDAKARGVFSVLNPVMARLGGQREAITWNNLKQLLERRGQNS